MKKRILIAGESWTSFTTHVKGFDTFYTSTYEEGVKWLKNALEGSGFDVNFMPGHDVSKKFPFTIDELQKYDAVILSDVGANTFLLSEETFMKSKRTPNRLTLIKEYVKNGGGFCMIGGYLSFMGIDAKARYKDTDIADILPVAMLDGDDRAETCNGVVPRIEKKHKIFDNIPQEWPHFLGYNKTRAHTEGDILASIDGNPFVAVREFYEGRTAVFTSDCSPHWAPKEFVEWEYYNMFWSNLLNWIIKT